MCSLSFRSLGLWGEGFLDQAPKWPLNASRTRGDLGHTFSIAHGLNMGSLTLLLLQDFEGGRAMTDELYPLAERNKFPWPLTFARFQRGWLRAKSGERDAGLELMIQAADESPAGFSSPSC